MRHRKKLNHLGRTSSHRKAMLANMASSLILHKRITTTVAKAKALRIYVEPLITRSKDDSTHSRRMVFSYLKNKYAVSELFREVSPKVADRPGGYTRILRTGNRLGDNADMCIIELVDYNENMLETQKEKKTTAKRSRRGRRGRGAGVADTPAAGQVKETPEKEVKADEATATEEVKEEAPAVEEVKEEAPSAEEQKQEETAVTEEAKEETPSAEEEKKDETAEEKKEETLVAEKKEEPPAAEEPADKDEKSSDEQKS